MPVYLTYVNFRRISLSVGSYVNEARLFAHPTTRLLIGLFDDYNLRASVKEDQETNRANKREIENFLTAIINTNVMKRTYEFVKSKRIIK